MINFLLSLTHQIGFVNCLTVLFRAFQSSLPGRQRMDECPTCSLCRWRCAASPSDKRLQSDVRCLIDHVHHGSGRSEFHPQHP